jgi:hypothetical protein
MGNMKDCLIRKTGAHSAPVRVSTIGRGSTSASASRRAGGVYSDLDSLYSTNEYRGSMHDRRLLLLAGLAKYAPVLTRRKLFYMCGISGSKAIL